MSMRALVLAAAMAACGPIANAAAAEPPPMSAPPGSVAEMLALPADNVRDALDSELRSVDDRRRDATEKIGAVLRVSGIARGMRVVDLSAGDGYFTQVASLAVRRFGKTWGNNDPAGDARAAAEWRKRLLGPGAGDISELRTPLGEPLPPFVRRIDIVFSRGAVHEAATRGVDPAAMHRSVFEVLSPGGKYVIVDARAAKSADVPAAASLCRMPEDLVRKDVEAAGFHFVSASDALAAPKDDPKRSACEDASADRFLLIFEKPKS